MKKLIVFMLISVMLISMIPSICASTGNSPEISATLLSQDPDPVEQGQIVKVKFKIENSGKETNNDIIVKIIPKFPFSIYGDETEKNIGKLRAASTGADAAVVEFRLKVDENAIEGDTEIEMMIQDGDGAISYTNDEFLVDIQTHDAVLDITQITSEPKQISPGESAKVTIMVKNMADSLLKDIKFKLDLSDTDLPLAPYQSSSERRISQLKSGYQNSLNFQLIADPSASPGLYKVPVTISYNDEKGNDYSISDILAITIGEIPKLRTFVKESSVVSSGKEGTLTLEVVNAGSTDVKFVELTILPSEDYQLISTSNYFYLGDIDSDDTESEDLKIYVNKNKGDKLLIPVQLKYYDANHILFQQTYDVEMGLYSSSELKKFGLVSSSNTWIYLLIIILGGGGYFFYRRYKKKNPVKK